MKILILIKTYNFRYFYSKFIVKICIIFIYIVYVILHIFLQYGEAYKSDILIKFSFFNTKKVTYNIHVRLLCSSGSTPSMSLKVIALLSNIL